MPDNKSKITGVIVVEGAKMNCSLGNLSQVPLTVNHKEDDKYFINQKKIATWREESIQHMNFGTCKRSNPQPACTPDISWKDYYENAEFGKQKILIDQSRGTCKYKGTVTIAQHGQKSQPSSQLYKKNNKNSYEIFMLSPQVAATQGKQPPSVSKIDLVVLPSKTIPANREVAFEIGGALKKITLVATVGKKDDKSLVSWAVYRGDDQKNRIKTYLEHGSTLDLNLEELPEGKTTIFGYGKTPSGDSTKIIINRKHNQLEGIGVSLSGVPMEIAGTAPKKTPVLFTPQYSFPLPAKKGFPINWKRKTKWTIADDKGTILYSSALGPLSSYPQGLVAISTAEETLVAMFINSGSYQVTLEDFTFSSVTQVSVKKTQSVTIKNRTAGAILNKSGESLKIRKNGRIHLEASGIKFDYGFEGLGQKAYWHVQKDSGKIINLGLRKDVNMTVSQLIEEFKKQQVLISSPYGLYKFQIDGEEKNLISIGSTSDTAVVEVGKNRMESIEGPEKIPVGAQVTYKIKALMSLAAGESVAWAQPLAPFIQFSLSADRKEARLQLSQQGKAHLSASLEGAEVSSQPIQKTVEASYVFLKKALWCYSNGKRRAETGWEEPCFIHVSLEGLTRTPVKLRVWVAHPEAGKEASIAKDACLLKEMEATLNDKGSCQIPFIADKEIKEKIQKVIPEENKQVSLFFTLEFTAGELLDLSDIPLIHQENKQEVPTVATQGKIQHLVLDPDEDLKLPAVPRIKAINFSNEAADDIQVGVTQYGKKHKIWIHTVGMPKQKLVVIVYKQLLKEDLKETYNHKEKAFAATAQVKKYEAKEVGADGLLTLDFTPEKKDADGDPQLFYVAVFKEQKNEKDETVLMELGSQLKSLDSLPFDQELNKDATQVGIVMPTLEEGQTPTAEQLKAIVSKFFHFYNPLYVSETGTIEDQQVISPVLVERGESKKTRTCYCERDFTEEEMKSLLIHMNGNDKIWLDGLITDKSIKSLTRELNLMFRRYHIDKCIQKITFLAQVNAEIGFFTLSKEKESAYKSSKSFYKGRGLIQLTGDFNDATKNYDLPGPYEKYGIYLVKNGYLKNGQENIFITNPELIATDLHYAVDSSGWEWNVYKKALTYERDYGVASKNADAKWKRDTFPKGLGKSLNEIALVYEETEEDKYFWFQSKILNGYTLSDRDSPDPHGWTKRKEGLRKVKQWFKYDKEVCKGEKELEFSNEGRAPWMIIAWDEYEKYKGLIEQESPLKEKIPIYFEISSAKGLNYNHKNPWCGAYIVWCFEQTKEFKNINNPKSAAAFGWLANNWKNGENCEAFVGATIIFDFSHVAFIVGENIDGTKYVYLGGNQGNGDKRAGYQKISLGSVSKKSKSILGITKPKKYIVMEDDKKLPKYDVNKENTKASSR
ncbi:PAAR-like protein [Apibacter sp. HY039]|uniref:PAAR-like protein n=1 Tax=Apibacter sp. HY039 TaxID=2501476 RepID=UPI000FEBE065|nr:PAAR-like protein [Apibacter sp. HY039]